MPDPKRRPLIPTQDPSQFSSLRARLTGVPVTQSVMPLTPGSVPTASELAAWITRAQAKPATTALAKAFAKDMKPLVPKPSDPGWDPQYFVDLIKAVLSGKL